VGFCVMKHLALRCIGMKDDFGWDTLQNPRRDMVPAMLKNFNRSDLRFARAISVHPMHVLQTANRSCTCELMLPALLHSSPLRLPLLVGPRQCGTCRLEHDLRNKESAEVPAKRRGTQYSLCEHAVTDVPYACTSAPHADVHALAHCRMQRVAHLPGC
jgi:hypothetical protein